jgi:hypothetical protein
MMAMDLDKDYNINGNVFKAGKNVDMTATDMIDGKPVKNDYSQAVKDAQESEKHAEMYGGHTSGVPTEADPTAPTSGTPTFPVGADQQAKENKQADKQEASQ